MTTINDKSVHELQIINNPDEIRSITADILKRFSDKFVTGTNDSKSISPELAKRFSQDVTDTVDTCIVPIIQTLELKSAIRQSMMCVFTQALIRLNKCITESCNYASIRDFSSTLERLNLVRALAEEAGLTTESDPEKELAAEEAREEGAINYPDDAEDHHVYPTEM